MAEDIVQLPPDGIGKKIRAIVMVVGANTVYMEGTVPYDEAGVGLFAAGGDGREAIRFAFGLVSIFVDNSLDQTVTVQFKANRQNNTTKAANMGATFDVAAASQDARSLSHETSGWLPYLYVEVSCAILPTAGALNIYLIRGTDEQFLVEALDIRDILTHDPDTDVEVTIKPW